jgi:hypothetical protein
MGRHFPRWLLTLAVGRERLLCRRCAGAIVFDRGPRCVACDQAAAEIPASARLAWFGLLPPVGIDSLERVAPALRARPPRWHAVGEQPGIGGYLLVPLVASYPHGFPEEPVRVAYLPGFFSIPGVPPEGASHETHMLGGGFMCLYAPGEWSPELSCREVLQQRAYAHVIKLLNYANGKHGAFAIVTRGGR